MKDKKFEEAVLHYTHAIKLSPKDAILYSNRSLAFLKINQLYYAHEDAEKAIELDENWAKGYFRKAEVLFNAGQYDTALLSYAAALQRMPNDMIVIDAARKAAQYSNRETMYDKRVPWVGAGIGIVLGVIIVLLDQLVTKVPTVSVSVLQKYSTSLYFLTPNTHIVASSSYGVSCDDYFGNILGHRERLQNLHKRSKEGIA